MVFISKIYTKGGDKGKTSLGDGSRLLKDAPRIEAIGSVDEANASLGLVRLVLTSPEKDVIQHIQNDLFDVGADLCLPNQKEGLRITASHVDFLEKEIDKLNADLTPLHSFVLPGGSEASAHLHLARTIVRRAERRVCTLASVETLNEHLIKYLNRLSDYLFVLGRFANEKGQSDILWVPGENR